ncbi:MAG: hypothetical protein AABW92_03255 [Nanoarchaeota archaeon]
MKALVFDTGPLINLALNNLLWVVEPLKKRFKGKFYITPAVRNELVEKPLATKRYKLEALQILKLIEDGVFDIYESEELKEKSLSLLKLSNSILKADENYIKNVQFAEIEAIVATKMLNADAVVIDEFVTRALIENPLGVKDRMQKKLHKAMKIDDNNLEEFKKQVSGIIVIRSFELITIAYEKGLFKEYYLDLKNPKETLLDGLFWGIKLNGCSVTEQEIAEIKKLEGF